MDFNSETFDTEVHGKKAVEALANDILVLARGISGKSPESIDFDVVKEYIDLLKLEADRVQHGIYAKDNSILYTSGDEISFDKLSTKSK